MDSPHPLIAAVNDFRTSPPRLLRILASVIVVCAAVTAVARVDGKEVWRKDGLALDAAGRLAVSFSLPKDVLVGDGTLALVVRDGGVQETAAKSIPIVVNRVMYLPAANRVVALEPETGKEIWRYPVKTMAGEMLQRVRMGPLGIDAVIAERQARDPGTVGVGREELAPGA